MKEKVKVYICFLAGLVSTYTRNASLIKSLFRPSVLQKESNFRPSEEQELVILSYVT